VTEDKNGREEEGIGGVKGEGRERQRNGKERMVR